MTLRLTLLTLSQNGVNFAEVALLNQHETQRCHHYKDWLFLLFK